MSGLFDNIFDRTGLVCVNVIPPSKGLERIAASNIPSNIVCQAGSLPSVTTVGGRLEGHGRTPPTPERVYPKEIFNGWLRVGAFTFGGVRDFLTDEKLTIGLGADITFRHQPAILDAIYGKRPSFQVFLRLRPGDMR